MIVLVPSSALDDLQVRVGGYAPTATLVAYEEDLTIPVPEAADAEVVLRWIAGKRYERFLVENLGIRYLHTASAGVDHVITPALLARQPDFQMTDSGPAFAISLSEYVVGWMLAVAHKLPEVLSQARERKWGWVMERDELSGKTVGIIGLGPIGQGIAERCRAMGMRTLGFRRIDAPVASVDQVLVGKAGLATLLQESDWVIVAAALTAETRALIGSPELAAMKPSARIVNIARGAMIDEDALIAALRDNRIAGACLDVFNQEPLPRSSPLWDLPNVYISPHSAGWTLGLRQRQMTIFLENLRRYTLGEPLANVVDKHRGY